MSRECYNYYHNLYNLYDRWVSPDCRVWEKTTWGWQFLGIAQSQHAIHVLQLESTDCDHPQNVISIED